MFELYIIRRAPFNLRENIFFQSFERNESSSLLWKKVIVGRFVLGYCDHWFVTAQLLQLYSDDGQVVTTLSAFKKVAKGWEFHARPSSGDV